MCREAQSDVKESRGMDKFFLFVFQQAQINRKIFSIINHKLFGVLHLRLDDTNADKWFLERNLILQFIIPESKFTRSTFAQITRALSLFCQWMKNWRNVLSSSFHSILNLELLSSDDYESQQHFLFCICTLQTFSLDSRVSPKRKNFSSCLPAFFSIDMDKIFRIEIHFTYFDLYMWQQLSNPQELSTMFGKFMRIFHSEVTWC